MDNRCDTRDGAGLNDLANRREKADHQAEL
jgi:hypothetical protein